MKPARVISALAVASVTLLAVACSDDSATAPTTGPSTSGEATTTSVDDNAPTTSGEAPTTTVEPITAPTDPNETTPDQSTTEPPTFEERAAQEKAQAVVDALPEGWVGAVVDATTASPSTAEFVLYNKCQGTDGYDFLNDFAADTQAAYQAVMTQKTEDDAPQPQGEIEARSFTRSSVADSVFQTLQAALTTDDGRDCLKAALPEALTGSAQGPDVEVEMKDTPIEGVDAGVQAVVTIGKGETKVTLVYDILANQLDDGTVVLSSFSSVTDPADPAAVSAMWAAATA